MTQGNTNSNKSLGHCFFVTALRSLDDFYFVNRYVSEDRFCFRSYVYYINKIYCIHSVRGRSRWKQDRMAYFLIVYYEWPFQEFRNFCPFHFYIHTTITEINLLTSSNSDVKYKRKKKSDLQTYEIIFCKNVSPGDTHQMRLTNVSIE